MNNEPKMNNEPTSNNEREKGETEGKDTQAKLQQKKPQPRALNANDINVKNGDTAPRRREGGAALVDNEAAKVTNGATTTTDGPTKTTDGPTKTTDGTVKITDGPETTTDDVDGANGPQSDGGASLWNRLHRSPRGSPVPGGAPEDGPKKCALM